MIGNPITKALATSYAKQFLDTQFEDDYKLESLGFNIDTKMYDYIVQHEVGGTELSYELTVNSKISDRKISHFSLHPSLVDEELSDRLEKEATPHVTNVVRNFFPNANVEYELAVPKGLDSSQIYWVPGISLDVNASIFINQTVDSFKAVDYQMVEALKQALVLNGIYYSRISIRIIEENEKNGITYMKTVYRDELFAKK